MMKFTTIMWIVETVCTACMVSLVLGSIDFSGAHQVAVIASIVGAHLLGIVSGMAFCYRRADEKREIKQAR